MRPAPALIWALLLAALLGVPVAFGWWPPLVLALALASLAMLALADALALAALPTPSVARDLAAVIPVGVEQCVQLRLKSSGPTRLTVAVHDLHPGDWAVSGLPRTLPLPPGREQSVRYRFTPAARGSFVFTGVELRLHSLLGLWRQRRRVDCAQTLRVYPNFAPLARLALIGADTATRMLGAHLKRRRGEGTEFQQLREYRIGDPLRQIDWKASQRARKLISREYQDERNQQVMLLLDTGRRMLAHDDGLSHFDHVLNAALLLAYLALRQGDAVGLLASGGAARYMAPARGLGAIDTLLNTVYDLDAAPVATDYLHAATTLSQRQSRRALVVLITNVRDEDIEELIVAVRQLRRRHLVVVASLRENVLETTLAQVPHSLEQAIAIAAMADYVEQRERAHRALRAQGCDLLDLHCRELPAALVEHYLAIKRAGRL